MAKRLFVAVDIDEATRQQISRVSAEVRDTLGTNDKASWVRADRMHMTLHFFGSADGALEQRVRDAMVTPIDEAAFDVTFSGLGLFPERGSPRVLWIGIREGVHPLRRLRDTFAERLSGVLGRDASFTPHLTLARFRDRRPRANLAKIADIPALAGPSRIDRVTLYESRLSPVGPTYLPLAEVLLRS